MCYDRLTFFLLLLKSKCRFFLVISLSLNEHYAEEIQYHVQEKKKKTASSSVRNQCMIRCMLGILYTHIVIEVEKRPTTESLHT